MKLTITDLQNFAKESFELGYEEEYAWEMFKTNHLKDIPEFGVKQIFINILKKLKK